MLNTLNTSAAKQLNPLVLAFIGDAVHSLWVRQNLVLHSDAKAGILHTELSSKVCASSQAKLADKAQEMLTEEEKEIFARGRNSKTNSIAKNCTRRDYQMATAFECVVGFLYITGQTERLDCLMLQLEA